jgi:pimeloyl-ACP methyl ester carboxylesterase
MARRLSHNSIPAHREPCCAAAEAWQLHTGLSHVLQDPGSPASNHSLAHFVERWKTEGRRPIDLIEAPDGNAETRPFRVVFEPCGASSYSLDYFDELLPAEDFEVQKLTHHRRAGAGACLVAFRENRHREPIERFYPPEGVSRPLTAVVRPGPVRGETQEVRVHLLCPLQHENTLLDGRLQPLAADFTVPWAALLGRSGALHRSGITDLLTRTPSRMPQLYLMEPYDPSKEPLIMIHGLLSTPLAWAGLSNDLWADPSIRSRYQIWHYLYNTSAPALYPARLLRGQLRDLRPMLDPSGRDPAMQSATLLAHSMGGIVAKALVCRPGDAFWDAAFTRSLEDLELSNEDREALRDAFFWEPLPYVDRVIFIAVPHRGSDFADNLAGRLGRWITGPPREFREFYGRISAANPGAFTPAYAALGSGRLDSVHALSPGQRTLMILSELPLRPGVAAHSIIGNRGKAGPLEKSSDGIVPYWSSHVDGVGSEKIVPAGHGAFEHPEGMAEILRILKL